MKIKQLLGLLVLAQVALPIYAASPHVELEQALLCDSAKTPKQVYNIVKKLSGHQPFNQNGSYYGEYTIPNGFALFNMPLYKFYIHKFTDDLGQEYVQYSTPFENETVSLVARYANLKKDSITGEYSTKSGVNQNSLAIKVINGTPYLVCTPTNLSMQSSSIPAHESY